MKRELKLLVLFVYFISISNMIAQVGINTDGSSPDTSAMLDVKSGDKGILIPRLDDTAMNNIASPVNGLMIYNTTKADFYYYNGSTWQPIGTTAVDNDWTVNGNDMYSAVSGKVGIGLTDPVGTLHIAYTNDAGPNGVNHPGSDLVIGDIDGQHMEVDNNEIHSMNGNDASTLYLNADGGTINIGAHDPATLKLNNLLNLKPSSAPSNPSKGDIYYDNGLNKLRCYDGTNWHNLWQ